MDQRATTKIIKVTYFAKLTEEDLQALQRGETVEKMPVRIVSLEGLDEFVDGTIEETRVELKLEK